MKKVFMAMFVAIAAVATICGVSLSTPPKANAPAAGGAGAADWPCWRGAGVDGKSPFVGIKKQWAAAGPTKVWEKDINPQKDYKDGKGKDKDWNGSPSSPVIKDGIVVVLGRNDTKDVVVAFDANKGNELWRKEYEATVSEKPGDVGYGPRATPCISDGYVYTLSANGTLNCWNLKTGDNKWTKEVKNDGGDMSSGESKSWGHCASPAVQGNTLYVKAGGKALVLAYEKTTGELLWKAEKGEGCCSSPAIRKINGKDVLVVFSGNGVLGLDLDKGKKLWDVTWKTAYGANVPTPQFDGNTMFVTSGYDAGCQAFKIEDNKAQPLWEKDKKGISSAASDPIIHDEHVYSFSGQGHMKGTIRCTELETGKELWSSDKIGNGSLVFVDGCLFCLTCKGEIALVEATPSEFKLLGKAQAFTPLKGDSAYASPAIAAGKAYVRFNGKLICYDLTK